MPGKTPIWELADVTNEKLPEDSELRRTKVFCNKDAPAHTASVKYGGSYASSGVDNSLTLEKFRENFKIEVKHLDQDYIEFEMVGIDASIANAFRRILIAELPTMAIDKVFMRYNNSIIQDEVLAHRLGLVPLNVDPRLFEYLSENDVPNEKNTIVFKLHASCEKSDSSRPAVSSNQLIWLPHGSEFMIENQTSETISKPKTYTSFSCSQDSTPEFSENPIAPTIGDIRLAVLGGGQEIELEAHAVKGIGKTHAKWSPVATAWYRMYPTVKLLQDVVDKTAEELKKICPVEVFDIEELDGKKKAKVNPKNERKCTVCRECIRAEGWDKYVALTPDKNRFIFKIESTGALPPEVLFTEAVKILEDKCERLITELS